MPRVDDGGAFTRLTGRAVLAGAAADVCAALTRGADWGALQLAGLALIGDDETFGAAILARAPNWDALALTGLDADYLLLAEAPEQLTARVALKRASHAGLAVLVFGAQGARPLRIDDLVGRALNEVDWQCIRTLIAGRRVLITGGGGSIGGQLARRIATLAPERLTLLDSSEYNLHQISQELPDATLALADVRDAAAMRRWLHREQPHLVFHTAALKQVPLVEQFPAEGALTNVCGLKHVADACASVGADLVFVSTDKAVDPSGVMGASKRLGELYCQALDREYAHSGGPRALPVRLGNVLGSTGSVIPLFQAQLAQGGPLTVTDAAMTRFFLSIPQAADFLLQAAAIGVGSERGRGAAFVVDMGEPLPVVDLARKIIRLGGRRPETDVAIVFVGARPGEKLHESLIAADEWREADPAPGVFAAGSAPRGVGELRQLIERLGALARDGADEAVITAIFAGITPPQAAIDGAQRAAV